MSSSNVKAEEIKIVYYGVSVEEYDSFDVSASVLSNVRREFFATGMQQKNNFTQNVDGITFKYNYCLKADDTIKWTVYKRKNPYQTTHQFGNDKYFIQTSDHQGKVLRRIYFDSAHIWQKTNYYSIIFGDRPVCSVVPFVLDGKNVILKYVKDVKDPEILYLCNMPKTNEVANRLVKCMPLFDASALTNLGVVFFANKENLLIFNKTLLDIEKQIEAENTPKVYIDKEDKVNGIRLRKEDFNINRNLNQTYDITKAPLFENDISNDFACESPYLNNNNEDAQSNKNYNSINFINSEDNDKLQDYSQKNPYDLFEQLQNCENSEQLCKVDDIHPLQVQSDKFADLQKENNLQKEQEIFDSLANCAYFDNETANDTVRAIDKQQTGTLQEVQNYHNIDDSKKVESEISEQANVHLEFNKLDDEIFADYIARQAVEKIKQAENIAVKEQEAEPDLTVFGGDEEYFYYGGKDQQGNRCGYGRTLMENGRTAYEGAYENDMRNGFGCFYYKNGNFCYLGDWVNNQKDGMGVCRRDSDGVMQIGKWKNDKPVGISARSDKDGNIIYVGKYVNGKRNGVGITYDENGNAIVSLWKDDNQIEILYKE